MADREEIRELVREALQQALEGNRNSPSGYFAPWTGVEYEAHPSASLFNIEEASVQSSGLIDFVESKICTIEKNRSCDQCGMCRSLGF